MPLTQVSSRAIEDTLRYVLGASGTNHYTFTGKGLTGAVNDPTLTLSRGHTYVFENRNSSGAHPFYIKTSIANGGTNDAYNTGVTNNGGAGGTEIVFTVPHDAPDLLYYQCSSHSSMAGQLKIAGAVADGSITESKLADGSVTSAKIANSSITSADFSADCVRTAALANDAVTADKLANSINTAIAANTAKDLTALSASNLTSGTVPDARFPATLPAASAANLTNVPAANITGTLPAISGANLTNLPASGKTHNHIYNGDMRVCQRGVAHQNVGNNANTYTLDRWKLYVQNSSARFQIEKNLDHSLPDGFTGSMRISCTTTDTSLAATDEVYLTQSLEGQDLMAFAKGTSSAKQYTLSFYARSDKTGTYIVTLLGRDNTNSTVSKSYTMSNSWTRHVITFPADTNSSRKDNNDNGEGLRIMFWLVAGSGVNNGTLQQTWANSTDTGRATGQVNFADSTNEFYITGVQLEVGDTVSDFAYEDYATSLAKCQRYFCQDFASNIGTMYEAWSAPNGKFATFNYPVEMRSAPTVNITNGVDGVVNGGFDNGSGSAVSATANASKSSVYFYNATTQFQLTGLTVGKAGVSFSAEF